MTRRNAEPNPDAHPCDKWQSCMCKGTCSCHWIEMPEETFKVLLNLRGLNERFYWLCFNAGIGGTAHAFIEFNGMMKVYIDLIERAARAGLDPQTINEHSKVVLPAKGHEMKYLAEKLRCMFGPVIDTNPEARAILLKELFPD